ncbi:phosphonate C-P lyase system protein PhnG [Halodurantibacterium flavum]|uniref:Phosphonate C-P lyase system protein PhnG n=1 Tax=Halodurantibacterium flavum TaxID=1382802 RepID=A0ABW4S5U5_9RHOB
MTARTSQPPESPPDDRRNWMSVLSKADPARLAELLPDLPPHDLLRAPEIGAVMVRGRQGGTGAPFNLGEMTVTRCSVRLPGGTVGHAMVQGRDKDHARRAALVDALMQGPDAAGVRARIIAPLAEGAAARAHARAARAAATKVEFFTMVRGED